MICDLCPRRCGAVRTEEAGHGFCRQPSLPVIARAALHHWEEPCISGSGGSGAVFFSGCVLRCVYCQNAPISRGGVGKTVTVERLGEIFRELAAQGAHNINLVSPTPFARAVREALEAPLPVPVVWNTGGYERVETLRTLEGKVQVWLPDLKYTDSALAKRYSGAEDYFPVARAAVEEMVRQTGACVLEDGLLKRGVLIRHLLLPGGLPEARAVMGAGERKSRDGLRGPDLPARGGSLLPHGPVHPPAGGPGAPRPDRHRGRVPRRVGLHGERGHHRGVHPGRGGREAGVYPGL